MTAPIVIKYEDWVAVIDDANKAQERVKKLEGVIREMDRRFVNMKQGESEYIIFQNAILFARKALEE